MKKIIPMAFCTLAGLFVSCITTEGGLGVFSTASARNVYVESPRPVMRHTVVRQNVCHRKKVYHRRCYRPTCYRPALAPCGTCGSYYSGLDNWDDQDYAFGTTVGNCTSCGGDYY